MSRDVVTVVRSVEELELLRPAWERLGAGTLTADLDWFRTTIELDPRVLRPHVVLVERDGEPHALVLGRVQDGELRCRLGYRPLFEPTLRILNVVYGGVLGDVGAHVAAFDALRGSLRRGEVDVVHLPAVRLGSPLDGAFLTGTARLMRSVAPARAHWLAHVPDSYDAFLRQLSSSTRQGVKRYGNKLERELEGRLHLERVAAADGIDGFFRDAARVSAKTYQGGLGVGVREDDELQRALVALGVERGWFRGYVLSIDDEPAAFWHGYAYAGSFRTMVPGYDPAYGRLNIGTYVLMKLVAELCEDPAVNELDFGFGDAEYKRRFGDRSWQEHDVAVFSPSAKAMGVHSVRSTLLTGVGVGRYVVQESGRVDRVKRAWRRKVAAGAREEAARPA